MTLGAFKILREWDLSTEQALMLWAVKEESTSGQDISSGQYSKYIENRSQPAVSSYLRALREKELIALNKDPLNRRHKVPRLTELGYLLIKDFEEAALDVL